MVPYTGGLLDLEIKKIIATKNEKTNNIEYTFTLHTPKLDIRITLASSVETLRNYNTNISDYTVATFIMMAGDYLKDVLPYRDILELTIKAYDRIKTTTSSTRYRFIITSNLDDAYGGMNSNMSKADLNKAGQFTVVGQCIIREAEAIRTKNSDGVFRGVNVKDVMIAEFTEGTKGLAIEGKPLAIGCDIVEPNNDYVYNHVTIPTGTKLLDLPTYLQTKDYGVYNGGIGTYIQNYNNKPIFFVYPLFDKDRYEKTTKKLLIYRSDSTRLTFIENTYQVDGDLVKIVVGKDIKNTDTGGTELLDTGDSLIASDPSLLSKRNAEVSDNKAVVSKTNQIAGSSISPRRDSSNNPVFLGSESNLYKHRSTISLKTGTVYQMTWNFPDPQLIYPGMPACLKYNDAEKGIIKLYGTVQGIYFRYDFATKTMTSLLMVMVTRPNDAGA